MSGEGERPAGYVVILQDTEINDKPFLDHGIAAQYILLGATEKELGVCMVATINRNRLRKFLAIDDRYGILLVVAIGKPRGVVKIEYIDSASDIKYWHDDHQVHHVPKRRLEDIILKEYT